MEVSMGKHEERRKYVHNYAMTLANRLGLQPRLFTEASSPQSVAKFIIGGFERHDRNRITEALNREGDETLGCLAMCARAPYDGLPIAGERPWVSLVDIWGHDAMFLKEDVPDGETTVKK